MPRALPNKQSLKIYAKSAANRWIQKYKDKWIPVIEDDTGRGFVVFPADMFTTMRVGKRTANMVIAPVFETDEKEIIRRPKYVDQPVRLKCPACGKRVKTVIKHFAQDHQVTIEWCLVQGIAEAMMKHLGGQPMTEMRQEVEKVAESAQKTAEQERIDELKRKFPRGL